MAPQGIVPMSIISRRNFTAIIFVLLMRNNKATLFSHVSLHTKGDFAHAERDIEVDTLVSAFVLHPTLFFRELNVSLELWKFELFKRSYIKIY